MNLTTRQIARLLVLLREPRCLEHNVIDANEDIFKLLTNEFVKRTSGKTLDFLQVVYKDWCDKHGFLYAHKEIPKQWLTERKKKVKL